MSDIPVILADWDEEKGPLIIDSLFPREEGDIDDSPEVLITRCYISAQSIFARVEFSKITFSIPMVSLKKLAIVFFDVVPDKAVRGGKRPFILVLFLPIETRHGLIDEIASHVEPFLDEYRRGTIPDLGSLQDVAGRAIAGAQPAAAVQPPAVDVVPVPARQAVVPPARQPREPAVHARTGPAIQPIRVVAKLAPSKATAHEPAGTSSTPDAEALLERARGLSIRVGPWKQAELDELRTLARAGKKEKEIAQVLGRTVKDVATRLAALD